MKAPFSKSNLERLDVLGVCVIATLLICVATFSYLISDFLYADDAIYVGTALFGAEVVLPSNFLNYWIIDLLSATSHLVFVKSLSWISISAISCSFYVIVKRFSGLRWASAALTIAFVFYPVSVDQGFFVSGAHPTTATAFFFVFLLLFQLQIQRGLQAGMGFNLAIAVLQAAFLYATSAISPTYSLAPLVLLVSTAAYLVAQRVRIDRTGRRIGFILCSVAVLLAASRLGSLNNYHYSQAPGWTSYSPERVFSNLGHALQSIAVEPLQDRPVLAWLFALALLGATTAIGFAFVQPHNKDSDGGRGDLRAIIPMGIVIIASSAFTFGPSSVVTAFLSRYLVAPYLSAALLIAILLGVGLKLLRFRHARIYAAANVLLLSAAVIGAMNYYVATRSRLSPLLASHNLLADAIRERTWKPDDQVLILLPEGSAESSLGFNHWSTWQLRVITRQRNIIGLIGTESRLAELQKNGLFVDEYADHGAAYWSVKNGKAARKQMIGLERNRSLYAFKPTAEGGLAPATVAIWEENAINVVPFGERVGEQLQEVDLPLLCQAAGGDSLFIGLSPQPPTLDAFEVVINDSFSFDGNQTRDVLIDQTDSAFVYISFDLAPNWDGLTQTAAPYSDTYPPMPLLSADLAIYDLSTQFRILAREGGMKLSAPARADRSLDFKLFGCPGSAGFVFLNDAFAGVLPVFQFSGNWRFGKGFKKRYWRGEVHDLVVGVAKRETSGN